MNRLHAWKPCEHRQQRQARLAVAAATLGLVLGASVGAAIAEEEASVPASEVATSAVVTKAVVTKAVVTKAVSEAPETSAAVDTVVADEAGSEAATVAVVAEPIWQREAEDAGSLDLMPLLVKVSFGLGLVVLLAWGTVYLLRRSALGTGLTNQGSAVRVLDRNWIGPKKAIYLVDIGGRTLALGVTEEHISVLSAWEDGEISVSQPSAAGGGAFATQFRALLSRRGEAAAQGASS